MYDRHLHRWAHSYSVPSGFRRFGKNVTRCPSSSSGVNVSMLVWEPVWDQIQRSRAETAETMWDTVRLGLPSSFRTRRRTLSRTKRCIITMSLWVVLLPPWFLCKLSVDTPRDERCPDRSRGVTTSTLHKSKHKTKSCQAKSHGCRFVRWSSSD